MKLETIKECKKLISRINYENVSPEQIKFLTERISKYNDSDVEPTKSIFFKEAAKFKLKEGNFIECMNLVSQGLSTNTPPDIIDEFLELFTELGIDSLTDPFPNIKIKPY